MDELKKKSQKVAKETEKQGSKLSQSECKRQ